MDGNLGLTQKSGVITKFHHWSQAMYLHIYSKTPIFPRPDLPQTPIYRDQFFPQIGPNMHIVNKQNPDLPRLYPFPQNPR